MFLLSEFLFCFLLQCDTIVYMRFHWCILLFWVSSEKVACSHLPCEKPVKNPNTREAPENLHVFILDSRFARGHTSPRMPSLHLHVSDWGNAEHYRIIMFQVHILLLNICFLIWRYEKNKGGFSQKKLSLALFRRVK